MANNLSFVLNNTHKIIPFDSLIMFSTEAVEILSYLMMRG